MNNTAQIRGLLQRKVVAVKNAANKTNDYIIPLNDRYMIIRSIRELKQILALLPCETCNGTGRTRLKYPYCPDECENCDCLTKHLPCKPCPDCQPS